MTPTPGKVHQLASKSEFDEYVTSAKGAVVLDAFAEWCGPCKMIAPVVEKLAEQETNTRFYQLDVDKLPDLAQELGITSMPTFLFFKDGEQVEKFSGANVSALETAVTNLQKE